MLLNVSFFIWAGAVCPWDMFAHNEVVPIYRLIFIGVLVLLFRRLPFVLAIHKQIHQIEEFRQALFVGFFGPIGVSAIFYLYVAIDFLESNVQYEGHEREDAQRLSETITVIVWFLVICSVVRSSLIYLPFSLRPSQLIHGLTIPVGKLGLYLPRTLSRAISTNGTEASFDIASSSHPDLQLHPADESGSGIPMPRPIWRIGGTVIRAVRSTSHSRTPSYRSSGPSTGARGSRNPSPKRGIGAFRHRQKGQMDGDTAHLQPDAGRGLNGSEDMPRARSSMGGTLAAQRMIRFPDEEPRRTSLQTARENMETLPAEAVKNDDESTHGSLPPRAQV
jgi:sodium/hydrogen antiporter